MQLTNEQITFIVLPGLFVLLLLMEQAIPLRQRKRGMLGRLLVNLCLTSLSFVAGSTIVRTTAFTLTHYNQNHSWGLLPLLGLPIWLQVAVGFLLMDLTFYYWHFANHRLRLLWRFHNVHHFDPDLDVSTSFRFHFVEVAYSAFFRIAQVALLGIVPLTYIIYEIIFQCATMFHHSNIRLPLLMEQLINKIFVTPRMHGIHHSQIHRQTDSNYSVIFRCWDFLHRTLLLNVSQGQIKIGVWGYNKPHDNKLWNAIIAPFCKQRPYWQKSKHPQNLETPQVSQNQKTMME